MKIHALKYELETIGNIAYCYVNNGSITSHHENTDCSNCIRAISNEKADRRRIEIFSIDGRLSQGNFNYYQTSNVMGSNRTLFFNFMKMTVCKQLGINEPSSYNLEYISFINTVSSIYNMVMKYFIYDVPNELLTNDNMVDAIIRATIIVSAGGEEKPNASGYVYKKY